MSMAAEQLDPEDFFRTNDMAMATYLKLRGHSAQTITWLSGTCYWVFRVTDALLDAVELFTGGEAVVEPKEYNRVFTQTKREFYDSKSRQEGATNIRRHS